MSLIWTQNLVMIQFDFLEVAEVRKRRCSATAVQGMW